MCWADKIPLTLFAMLVLLFVLIAATGMTEGHPESLVPLVGLISLTTIAPLWLILRLVDAFAGGPARRRGVFTVRPLSR
jgi:hypothetical protein